MTSADGLADLRATACDAARCGGQILLDWRSRFTASQKAPRDFVTEADIASERAIVALIGERFPDHAVLGEEGGARGASEAAYRWIIDPLDGTSNYVHGFPYFAVSVAVEHEGRLLAGAIFDPNRAELFSAALGCGATLNDASIEVSTCQSLDNALCMASLPVAAKRTDLAVARFLRVLEAAQHVQRTGSAALNLCGVASGRIDGFWSMSLRTWDVAAGALIVREAGGRVTQTDGGDFDVNVPDLLATNGTAVHDALIDVLRDS